MPYVGETAALATAVCWSMTSLLFNFAVLRLGSFTLNVVRITIAMLALWALVLALQGAGWVSHARGPDLLLLAISGWIGLSAGDWAYLRSLQLLGPRLATLLSALAPPMTAVLGFLAFRETPGRLGAAGMALTLIGVAWVVLERQAGGAAPGHRIRGVFLGAAASLGQAIGLILSKIALAGGIDPLPATAVRMTAGAVGIWSVALVAGRPVHLSRMRGDRRLVAATLGATCLGPVCGIWLSLVAVRYTQAGIAATLISTMPLLVLPLVILVQKERVSPRAALGAAVAVLGVALLFSRH
jgi:drug/metabolite transporter (DMT)-like permease